MPGSRVPDDYFADRYLGQVAIDPAVRFVDVDHPDTHASLTGPLRPLLRRHVVTRSNVNLQEAARQLHLRL